MPTVNLIFISTFFIWIAIGLLWLLPKKIRLMKRVGWISNADVIKLANGGDKEASALKKQSTIYIAIGIVVLVPLIMVSKRYR